MRAHRQGCRCPYRAAQSHVAQAEVPACGGLRHRGFTRREGGRSDLAALLLGTYRGKRLAFVGRAGTGFNEESLSSLRRRLQEDLRTTAPFDPEPALRRDERPRWVEPRLVAQVRFAGWTQAGLLRHPVFLALREDREPRMSRQPGPHPRGSRAERVSNVDAGPSVTHPTASSFRRMASRKCSSQRITRPSAGALAAPARQAFVVLRSVAQGKTSISGISMTRMRRLRRVSPPAGSSAPNGTSLRPVTRPSVSWRRWVPSNCIPGAVAYHEWISRTA